MKPVYFQGVNYDPVLLAALAPEGVRSHIPTHEVSDLISCREMGERIAVRTGSTYHLLTGAIDKRAPSNQLVVLAPSALKRAALKSRSYAERRALTEGMRSDPHMHFISAPTPYRALPKKAEKKSIPR